MPVTLLLTRPEEAARRFQAQLARPDLPVVVSPLLRILPMAPVLPARDWAALILTSENGARAAARLGLPAGLPAHCVGPQTTAAAAQAGFAVVQTAATAADLVARVLALRPHGALLHLHGEHVRGDVAGRLRAGGLDVSAATAYRQSAQPLADAARALLQAGGPVVLPLFSPRSVTILAGQGPFAAPIFGVAISPAVARAAQTLACRRLTTAATPDGPAMRAAVMAVLDDLSAP